jgi:hypothetical protein
MRHLRETQRERPLLRRDEDRLPEGASCCPLRSGRDEYFWPPPPLDEACCPCRSRWLFFFLFGCPLSLPERLFQFWPRPECVCW